MIEIDKKVDQAKFQNRTPADEQQEAAGNTEDNEALLEEEAPFPEAQGCKHWHCPWRWGWAEETWKPLLEALCPPLSVLCGSFHLQPGFLMAMLGYNEERYGLDRCNMIAFYPRNSAVKEEGVRPKRKAIEQGHMADHVLASVSAVYADFRLAASKAVRKQHLFRATSREAEPLAKLVKQRQP